MVPLVPQGRPARLGRTAPQVPLGPQDQLGLAVLDLLAPLGLLALQVALVLLDLTALLDLLVLVGLLVALDLQVRLGRLGLQAHKFLMVVVTLLALQVLTVIFI